MELMNMSVALAIVSQNGTVVASEGRAIQNCTLVSDCFNKTFSLLDGGILGAHTGLLKFSGMKIGEHIDEIAKAEHANTSSLEKLIKLLIDPFTKRVENIDSSEVGFQHREIDILLARRPVIYLLRFKPGNNGIFCEPPKQYPGAGAYCICGDDNAQDAAKNVIRALRKQIPSMRSKSLIGLARRAVQKGIDNAGPSKQNKDLCSCGGEIYHRYI